MAMDFFQHQDDAKRRTKVLVFYFILAVIAIIISVYLSYTLIFGGIQKYAENKNGMTEDAPILLWDTTRFVVISGATLILVLFGSLFKIMELRGGGSAVALMMGGRLLDMGSGDPAERKLLNVVEEMSIASGTPMPPVYVMDDELAINAFAAGDSPENAVIGVTRGCMNILSRDELQGVIAHEFSHIMNGDMKLNIKLIGILNGILIIGLLGYGIFRMCLYSGATSSRRNSKEGGGRIAILVFGLLIMAIGYVGVFFGKLIKSAVSRQREYLADASAVQFTRNPDGIGGALKKIGGLSSGSEIQNAKAPEISHLFFSNGLSSSFMEAMSTHPPLPDRIKRIDPNFDYEYPELSEDDHFDHESELAAGVSGFSASSTIAAPTARTQAPTASSVSPPPIPQFLSEITIDPEAILQQVGTPGPQHLEYARAIHASIPEKIMTLAREAYGARAVVYALLLNHEDEFQRKQLERLSQHADPAVYEETIRLIPDIVHIQPQQRLPIVDIALASLQNMAISQYDAFKQNVTYLVEVDDEIDLFEYVIQHIILKHLEPHFYPAKKTKTEYFSLKAVADQCAIILSILARVGNTEDEKINDAINLAKQKLPDIASSISLLPPDQCSLHEFDNALKDLQKVSVNHKRAILNACILCVAEDKIITINEAELLRTIADSLDCPMPPILPGQELE
ncbi:M48 family metallopeptidase [bacterium AH-315-E10]|nr:M48 family metallopeptidase [bacterium AH-315-E10]